MTLSKHQQRETPETHTQRSAVSAFVINGEFRRTTDCTDEIHLEENNITITPLQGSKIDLYCINNSARSFTQTITVNFHQPQAEVNIFGLYQGYDQHVLSITTKMNHAVPHCTSRQVWRGVMTDASKATFEGLITVAKHAQKTVAHLSNKNLLLSKEAEINTRPFLKIDADDVQCTHGATVGCLDEAALFYLRSRGLPEGEARGMLIQAFVNEIMDLVEVSHA